MSTTLRALQPLTEQYRPRSWDEVIGQDDAVKRLSVVANRGFAGRAWWINGQTSGIGKTTLALLIAREVCEEHSIIELDAGVLRAEHVQPLERSLATFGMGEKIGRAVLVNEAHALMNYTVKQLLVTLERIPRHVCWIFTTSKTEQKTIFKDATDAAALISRCVPIKLKSTGLVEPFAAHAKRIAETEQLGGKPIEAYEQLARMCNCNLRAMLNRIEAGEMLSDPIQ